MTTNFFLFIYIFTINTGLCLFDSNQKSLRFKLVLLQIYGNIVCVLDISHITLLQAKLKVLLFLLFYNYDYTPQTDVILLFLYTKVTLKIIYMLS